VKEIRMTTRIEKVIINRLLLRGGVETGTGLITGS
jgi:hypothetical protein